MGLVAVQHIGCKTGRTQDHVCLALPVLLPSTLVCTCAKATQGVYVCHAHVAVMRACNAPIPNVVGLVVSVFAVLKYLVGVQCIYHCCSLSVLRLVLAQNLYRFFIEVLYVLE